MTQRRRQGMRCRESWPEVPIAAERTNGNLATAPSPM